MATRQISFKEFEKHCCVELPTSGIRKEVLKDWGLELKLTQDIQIILGEYFILPTA